MDAAPGVSPSFNSYFNNKFAEMAARVVGEFDYHEEFIFNFENDTELVDDDEKVQNINQIPEEEENEEFEFTFAPKGSDNSELLSPISAGEIFKNGLIRPVYPLFNRDLLLTEHEKKPQRIRIPLRKLFFEERETTLTTSSSSSSSGSENMDGVPAETYCLWQPKESRVEKSSSTGYDSKRWKFSDLLHRSKSDGSNNDRLVILGPINQSKVKQAPVGGGKSKTAAPRPRNRSGGEKGHLTYRQELVGFFGRVM